MQELFYLLRISLSWACVISFFLSVLYVVLMEL